jgi:hypothetical protein
MAKEGGIYYVFSTGDPAGSIGNGNIQIRTSRDLRSWRYAGTVFADKPAWITGALGDIPKVRAEPSGDRRQSGIVIADRDIRPEANGACPRRDVQRCGGYRHEQD